MPVFLAIPEVDAVILALVGLCLLLGFEPTRRLLTGLLGLFPVIGSQLAGIADRILTAAWNAVTSWIDSILSNIDDFIKVLYQPLQELFTAVELTFESVYSKLQLIIQWAIPEAINWVMIQVHSLVDGLYSALTAAISTIYNELVAAIDQLANYAASIYTILSAAITQAFNTAEQALSVAANDIVAWAEQTFTELATSVYGAVNSLVSWAVSSFQAIETWATTEIQGVVSWTAGEIAALEGSIATGLADIQRWVTGLWTTAISAPLSVIWDNIQRPANAVVEDLTAEYPDIAATLQGISTSVPLDAAAAITSLGAITIPLTTFVDRCGIPMCKNLSNFGKDLNALENVFSSGLFLAFVAAAVADPNGAAKAFHTVVDDTIKPFIDDVKQAI